jgi:hypothetical protein
MLMPFPSRIDGAEVLQPRANRVTGDVLCPAVCTVNLHVELEVTRELANNTQMDATGLLPRSWTCCGASWAEAFSELNGRLHLKSIKVRN